MATASVSITPECSICFETFQVPKILPCGHTFCVGCLERYIGDKTGIFPCPICQQDVKIPDGGAKMFTTNFIVPTSPHTTPVTGTTAPTTQVTGTTSPTTPVTGTPSTTPHVTGTTAPTTQVTGTSPTTQVTGATPPTTQVTGATSPTTQVTGATAPTTQVTGATAPTTQVTGATAPTTQVTGATAPTTQVTGTRSPTTRLTDKTFSNVKYHCPCHSERQINHYCLTCHCVLCHKCYVKEHKDHEYLDVECETAKEKAIEIFLTSEKFIQNKIKDFEESHAALVEARETLQCFTEDACSRITKQTDKIIADIKANSERMMTDIENKSKESESKLTEIGEELMESIDNFKLRLETNFPSVTKDCGLQMLVSLDKMKKLEKSCKVYQARTLSVVPYLDWKEHAFSLNISMLGSIVLKQIHITKQHESNSYQFLFNTRNIDYGGDLYYNKYKFRNNNLVWSCCIMRTLGILDIGFELNPFDNPRLNYCIVDGQINLLNIDDIKSITYTDSNKRLERGGCWWWWSYPVNIPELDDKNNGYINFNSQFVIQFDITQIRKISWK